MSRKIEPPGKGARVGGRRVARDRSQQQWAAERAACRERMRACEAGIEAPLKADLQRHPGLAHSCECAIGLLQGLGDGLLAEDRLARPGGGFDDLTVEGGRRGDHNRVNVWLGEQRAVIGGGTPAADGGGHPFGCREDGVGDADQPGGRQAVRQRLGVERADRACADERDIHHGALKGSRDPTTARAVRRTQA